MNKPIINPSTLSEEQREVINRVYKTASFVGNESIVNTLEWLFGSEFFNQKGEWYGICSSRQRRKRVHL